MKSRTDLLVSLATTRIAGYVLACGDSPYRVGKGVSYRVMLAEKDEIKHYLKAIHQTLKQRG